MNNLKRVLSLGMAGTMLAGMMTAGAADFTDAEEINHTEAVKIATALNIIDGYDDGSFNPTGTVTRGQMAKMITRAMYGGEDPILGVKANPSFTDIKGRWDEAYIEYCFSAGIINGRGDGTFDADATVTGTEAAKMLLSALGYNVEVYGFTGTDWAINTNAIANTVDAKLYNGLKGIDPNAALTRDNAAQMIYNALNAKTKEMRPTTSTNGTIEYTFYTSDPLLYAKYGAVRVEGVVTDNEFTNNSEGQAGKTNIKLSNGSELTTILGAAPSATQNMKVSSGAEEFGKAVIVYAKPSASNPKDLTKAEVICEVIVDDSMNTVYTTTAAINSGDTVADFVKDNGLKLGSDVYKKNYADLVAGTPARTSATLTTNNGEEITIIDNDGDGNVDYVLHNTTTFGQVTKYSTKGDGSVTVKTSKDSTLVPSNEELKNVVAYEGIAVDDYVNVTKVDDTYYITKAEVLEGNLDAFKSSKNVTVAGETVKLSGTGADAYTASGLKNMTAIAANSVVGEDVTVYLDAYGYAVAGDTKAASDFLFVANAAFNKNAVNLGTGALTVYAYLEDGTAGSYTVSSITNNSGTKIKASDFTGAAGKGASDDVKGKLFKYTLNNDGQLDLFAAAAANDITVDTSSKTTYKKGQSTVDVTISTVATKKYVTNDTVVFFVSLNGNVIDSVRVYTGKTAPSMDYTTSAQSTLWVGSGTDKYDAGTAMITNTTTASNLDAIVFCNATAKETDYLYLVSYVKTTSDGAVFNAIVDGEFKQITTNSKTDASALVNNAYEYTMDGELFDVNLSAAYSMTTVGEVTLADDKSIVVGNTEGKLTASTVTALIDGDDTSIDVSISEGDVISMIRDTGGNIEAAYIIAEYDDTKAKMVWYDGSAVSYASNTYTVDLSDAGITAKATDAASDLIALFRISGKATVKLVAGTETITSGTTAVSAIKAMTDIVDGDVDASASFKLVVIAESAQDSDTTGYTVYDIAVQA